jgi:prepilin-type N-terminal cleavage/methylation domain-containing protein
MKTIARAPAFMPKSARSARRGMSLIEVVLAMVILSLAIGPVLLSVAAGAAQQQSALIEQNLVELASERLWGVFVDRTDPTKGYAAITSAAYPNETAPRGLTGYSRRTEIREVSPTDYYTPQAGSGLKRLRVTASGPGNRTLVIESLVADLPPG